MMALVKKGANRQEAHAWLRDHSMTAWEAVQRGEPNPLKDLVKADQKINSLIPDKELDELFQVESYTGIAEKRSREMARTIREQISR